MAPTCFWTGWLALLLSCFASPSPATTASAAFVATSDGDYLNPNTGRFWTRDSYEGIFSDPESLHKYLYAQDNPVDHIDPSGLDVFKVVSIGGHDASSGLAHHRLIIGDDGRGGSYTLEKGGNGGAAIRTAFITYTPHPKLTAGQVILQYTGSATKQNRNGSSGYIDDYVNTANSVDVTLNRGAKALNGEGVVYIYLWDDCGTFANQWLASAYEAEKSVLFPYSHPSTGEVNYIFSFDTALGGFSGM